MANVVEIIVRAIDKTKSGLTTPIKNIDDLAKSVGNLAPAFATITTAAVAAFGVMSKHAIDVADETGKAAQAAGIATNRFSTLAYAANLSNIGTKQLSQSFKFLNSFLSDANAGMEKNRDILAQLGVAYKNADGTVRNADAVLLDIADKFSKTADGAGKAAFAVDLFGKNGQEMIPFLNAGAAGIRDLESEARSFGLEIGGNTAKQAENFNDNLTRLKSAAQGVAQQFVAQVLPALVEVTEKLVSTAKETGFFTGLAQTLVQVFQGVVSGLRFIWAGFKIVGEVIGTVASILVDLNMGILAPIIGVFNVFVDTIKSVISAVVGLAESAGAVGEVLTKFFTGDWEEAWKLSAAAVENAKGVIVSSGSAVAESWKANGEKVGVTILQSYENIKAATKSLAADIHKELSGALDFSAAMFDPQSRADEGGAPNKPQLNRHDDGTKDNPWLQKYAESLMRAAELERDFTAAIAEQELLRQGVHAVGWEAERLILEQKKATAEKDFQDDLQRIGKLQLEEEDYYKLTTLAAQKRDAVLKQLDEAQKKRTADLIKTGLRNTLDGFTDAAQAAGQHSKTMFDIWKGLATAQAVVDMYSGAIAAYKSLAGIPYVGPALGAAAAAAVISFGAAKISSIQSQSFSPSAHAGLDYVPEDQTVFLQRGERVVQGQANEDLTNFLQGSGRNGSQSGPSVVEIHLDGEVLARAFGKMSGDGRLVLNARSIV